MDEQVNFQEVAAILEQRIGQVSSRYEGEMAVLRSAFLAELRTRDQQIAALQAKLEEKNVQKESPDDTADAGTSEA